MKSTKVKLSAFLLLGLGAAIYLWWNLSDEQAVLRRTDLLLETASVNRLSFGDPDQPYETFQSIIADPVSISGSHPIPSNSYSREAAVGLLRDYRESVAGAKISRLETTVTFPSPDEALVHTLLESDLSLGGGRHSIEKYRTELAFERSPDGWILTRGAFIRQEVK